MGSNAGYGFQGSNTVAIGTQAGYFNQSTNSIAIGYGAGFCNQAGNTIILNASGTNLSGTAGQSNSFYVNPVRVDTATAALCNLQYNTGTKEITYTGTSAATSNIRNVSSLQGNFSSIGINCNFPQYILDVNGTINASADVIAYSDRRIKENIIPITQALQKIQQLQGVYYTRKDQEDKSRKIGFIAQEVEEVVPEVVMTDSSEDKKKSIAYQNLTALLAQGMKEQQAEMSTFKATFYTLASEHSTIKSMFTEETSTLQGNFLTLATEHSTLKGRF